MPHDISLPNLRDIFLILEDYSDVIAFYFPLGIIGFWRWGTWLSKKIIGLFYKPKNNTYSTSVSIITPVYNENPSFFLKALKSWAKNKPNEIIAVIDHTDTKCIAVFKEFAKSNTSTQLIITTVPGKRPALARGIKRVKGNIVALVDSDTVWTKDTLKGALCPFVDPKVGGVGTRQNVLKPKTAAQRIFNIQLNMRYIDEMPFLAVSSDALTCLSGRSAFYRKKALLPILQKVVNETFQGKKVISGEDKRITYLVEQAGWKVTFQSNARVFTHGTESFKTFLNQRIRWSRNSWRADLRVLKEGWVLKHPVLTFQIIDKAVQPFTSIISPLYFFLSLLTGFWIGALIIVIWWHVSRIVKIFPHLRQNPKDIFIITFYVVSNFLFGIIKIYALFTMNHQGWITRWDAKRLSGFTFFQKAPAYAATILVFFMVGSILTLDLTSRKSLSLMKQTTQVVPGVLGIKTTIASKEKQTIAIHEIKEGDTLSSIADEYGVPLQNILQANEAILPNWNIVEAGMLIAVPNAWEELASPTEYNYEKKYYPPLTVDYDESTNTIVIEGRGNSIALSTIRDAIGEEYIRELGQREWLVSANILIRNGVTFRINQNEAKWVKLLSSKNKFVKIAIENGTLDIQGVKVTSWDPSVQDVDKTLADGRSYVLAKYASLVRINDSELAYLGYPSSASSDSTYGVSFKVPENSKEKYFLTGQIMHSKFNNNYVGIYISSAWGINLSNNLFNRNITHGLHIDNYTKDFVIKDNTTSDNGKYGIILSDGSTKNLLQGNRIYNNELGIILQDASQNTLLGNKIFNNVFGLRLNKSLSNEIRNNNLENNNRYGMYVYKDAADNFINNNKLLKNAIALLIQGSSNIVYANTIQKNRTGIYLSKNASENRFLENQINENRLYSVFIKTEKNAKNFLVGN